MGTYARVTASALVWLGVSGCHTVCHRGPTPLPWGLESQLEPSAVREALSSDVWVESETTNAIETAPRYEWISVGVGPRQHLGYEGDTTLLFFNDRLFSVVFVPEDAAGYFEAVASLPDARSREELEPGSDTVWFPPRTKVLLGEPNQVGDRAMVEWYDSCLMEERSSWLTAYASNGPEPARPRGGSPNEGLQQTRSALTSIAAALAAESWC